MLAFFLREKPWWLGIVDLQLRNALGRVFSQVVPLDSQIEDRSERPNLKVDRVRPGTLPRMFADVSLRLVTATLRG